MDHLETAQKWAVSFVLGPLGEEQRLNLSM